MSRHLHASVLGLLAALAGCNAYDPNLGYEPFKCGTTEPRCPLGYTCVTFSGGEQICQQSNADFPDAGIDGGGSLDCNDDNAVEPNDSVGQAFDTGIPDVHAAWELVGLAICPQNDVDVFKFEVATSGVNVVAEIDYHPERGILLVDVLNMSGTSIASGTVPDGSPNLVRAEVANLPAGTYYVEIKSTSGVQNNYDSISISTTGG